MAGKKRKQPELSREPIVTDTAGWTRYECPFCGRDSDSESTVRDHIVAEHPVDESGAETEATDDAAGDGEQKDVSDGAS